jgi:hypothetical protein
MDREAMVYDRGLSRKITLVVCQSAGPEYYYEEANL